MQSTSSPIAIGIDKRFVRNLTSAFDTLKWAIGMAKNKGPNVVHEAAHHLANAVSDKTTVNEEAVKAGGGRVEAQLVPIDWRKSGENLAQYPGKFFDKLNPPGISDVKIFVDDVMFGVKEIRGKMSRAMGQALPNNNGPAGKIGGIFQGVMSRLNNLLAGYNKEGKPDPAST